MDIVKDIKKYIESIKDLKILVIGETIIDEYQYGHTLGKVGKFPIVAFKNEKLESYPGGVIAICNHLKSFCDVDYWTQGNAIIKRRYIHNNQKLFETYTEKENRLDKFHYSFSMYDLIIVADFGHGMLNKNIRKQITCEAKFMALNTQFNAGNMGMNTINKYNGWNYLCIDEIELRLATSNQYDSVEDIIRDTFDNQIVCITESDEGCIVYKNKKLIKIPAFAKDIKDTVGAGDAFLSITSPLAFLDAPAEIIGTIGNIAGAIACSYPGNKNSVTKKVLYKFIEDLNEK